MLQGERAFTFFKQAMYTDGQEGVFLNEGEMEKQILKKCHRRYYPLSLNIDTQYRMQLKLFLTPGRT